MTAVLDPLSSSAALIKYLKTNQAHSTLSKIEVAQRAWDLQTLYVPRKGEVLGDWVLKELLKDSNDGGKKSAATKDQKSNTATVMLSLPHWSLVHSILSQTPLPTYIPTLLSQNSLLPLFNSFLLHIAVRRTNSNQALLKEVTACLKLVLNVIGQSIGSTALLDLYGSALAVINPQGEELALLEKDLVVAEVELLQVVSEALDGSLATNLTRKKISQVFIKNFLNSHLALMLQLSSTNSHLSLQDILSRLLSSLLFPLEVLKETTHHNLTSSNKHTSKKASSQRISTQPVVASQIQRPDILPTLPPQLLSSSAPAILLKSYITLVKSMRHTLFPVSVYSRVPAEVHATSSVREVSLAVVNEISNSISTSLTNGRKKGCWAARMAILKVVEDEVVYDGGDASWKKLLNDIVERGIQELDVKAVDDSDRDEIISCLDIVLRMDYQIIEPFVPDVLQFIILIASQSTHSPSLQLLSSFLSYYTKTRQIPSLVTFLSSSIGSAFPPSSSSPSSLYATVALGPLFSFEYQNIFSESTRTSLTTAQVTGVITHLKELLQAEWSEFKSTAPTSSTAEDKVDSPKPSKKRKLNESTSTSVESLQSIPHESAAAKLSLLSRILSGVLRSIDLRGMSESTVDELKAVYFTTITELLSPMMAFYVGKKDHTWANQRMAVSALNVWTALYDFQNVDVGLEWQSSWSTALLKSLGKKKLGGEMAFALIHALVVRESFQADYTSEVVLEQSQGLNRSIATILSGYKKAQPWDRRMVSLSSSKVLCTAVWALTSERFLSLMNTTADAATLDVVASTLLLSLDSSSNFADGSISMAQISYDLLHTDEVWELSNLKNAIGRTLASLPEPECERLVLLLEGATGLSRTLLSSNNILKPIAPKPDTTASHPDSTREALAKLSPDERTELVGSLLDTVDLCESEVAVEASLRAVAVILREGSQLSERLIINKSLAVILAIIDQDASTRILFQAVLVIGALCSEKAGYLLLTDMGAIWSVLNFVVTASPLQDAKTGRNLFTTTMTAASNLLRLRRDLVAPTAPLLASFLSLSVMCLRSPRNHLGSRHTRDLAKSLPKWITLDDPLGSAEGKSLARLLTGLTVKTIPRPARRSAIESTTAAKAESLARIFSKHAPFVLVSYMRAVLEPTSVMDVSVRKELEPGLFALCEMTGDKERDAILVSVLDADGKSVFKLLLADYQRQKYVGRG